MKKNLKQYLLIALSIASVTFPNLAHADAKIIDESDVAKGIIKVNYSTNYQSKYKLAIEKDGQKQYFDLAANTAQSFPLIYDNGSYTIKIMQNTSGNSYKSVYTQKIDAYIADDTAMYLASTAAVNWSEQMMAIKKAEELTKNLQTDKEKFDAIYNYVIKNYSYDYNKAATVKPGYMPDIEKIYESKSGICYDYSVLFASMLRSQGIPAKVVKGSSTLVNEYHAWNEVFIDGNWIIVDTTVDAAYSASKAPIATIKSSNQYTKISEI